MKNIACYLTAFILLLGTIAVNLNADSKKDKEKDDITLSFRNRSTDQYVKVMIVSTDSEETPTVIDKDKLVFQREYNPYDASSSSSSSMPIDIKPTATKMYLHMFLDITNEDDVPSTENALDGEKYTFKVTYPEVAVISYKGSVGIMDFEIIRKDNNFLDELTIKSVKSSMPDTNMWYIISAELGVPVYYSMMMVNDSETGKRIYMVDTGVKTIEYDTNGNMELPETVKISKFLVKSGGADEYANVLLLYLPSNHKLNETKKGHIYFFAFDDNDTSAYTFCSRDDFLKEVPSNTKFKFSSNYEAVSSKPYNVKFDNKIIKEGSDGISPTYIVNF